MRHHDDLDIELARHDQREIWQVLPGWDLAVASDGRLRPFRRDEWLGRDDGSLWCRPDRTAPWALQVMFCEVEGSEWVYRRDARIHRPLDEVMRGDASGMPYLAPEIQLLFKSKSIRPKDEADFAAALPHLDAASRRWLAASLRVVHPDHAWIVRLA